MNTSLKFIIFIFASTLLTACVPSPKRQALGISQRHEIKSTKLLLNTTQHAITMQQTNWFTDDMPDPDAPMDSGAIVQPAGGYVSGLLPTSSANVVADLGADLVVGGMEEHASNKAKRELKPFQLALGSFNYLHYFKNSLTRNVANIPWLKVKSLKVRYKIKKNENQLITNNKENSILFVGTTYAFNTSFNRLETVAYVQLARKLKSGEKSNSDGKYQILYANNFYYVYRLNRGDGNKLSNRNKWLDHHADLLKTKLREAARKLSQMIAMDIKNPSKTPYAKNKIIKIRTLDLGGQRAHLVNKNKTIYEASVISKNNIMNGGIGNGYMYAINKNSIEH